LRTEQGFALGLVCEHLGVLPSELMKRHPTITDMVFLATYYAVKGEQESNRIKSMMGGMVK